MIERTNLELAVDLATRAISLPAIATCNWCQTAAEAISVARPQCIAVVRFIDAESGAAPGKPWPAPGISIRPENRPVAEAVRAAAEEDLARPILLRNSEDERQQPDLAVDAQPVEQNALETDPAVSILSFVGARSALVASVVIDPERRTLLRVVIAETPTADEPPFTGADSEALRAALARLTQRARLAFLPNDGQAIEPLNRREVEVLDSLNRGRTIREIASSMHRSTHTIHDYHKSMHRKIGVANRAELIARAAGRCGPKPAPVGGAAPLSAAG